MSHLHYETPLCLDTAILIQPIHLHAVNPLSMKKIFTVGSWKIEKNLNRISLDGKSKILAPKEMEVLCYLCEKAPNLVQREELHNEVWKGVFVNENTINRIIANLRKALEDDWKSPQTIETVSKSGYRIIGKVTTNSNKPFQKASNLLVVGISLVIFIGVLFLALVNVRSGDNRFLISSPITSFPGLELEAELSPDETLLAFSRRDQGNDQFDIYINVLGTDTYHPLAATGHNETNPIWSGSGKHLAYTREIDGAFEVVKTTIFGKEHTSLGTFTSDPTADWSKNEKWLLITDESPNGSIAVFGYEIATGKRKQLTFPDQGSYGDLEPTFSPSGKHVAFRRIHNEYVQDLFVLNLVDTTEKRLTEGKIRISGIAWTPSGGRITYSSLFNGRWKMSAIDIDQSRETTFHVNDRVATHPGFSSDNSKLLYVRWNSLQNISLTLLNEQALLPGLDINSVMIDRDPAINSRGQVAFVSNRSGADQLWITRKQNTPLRLTQLEGIAISSPKWSSNNEDIVFEARDRGKISLSVINTLNKQVKQVLESNEDLLNPSWIDHNTILFSSFENERWVAKSINLETKQIKTIREDAFKAIETERGLYYNRYGMDGIWKDDEVVVDALKWNDYGNWAISGGRIIYYDRTRNSITAYDLRTRNSQVIQKLDKSIPTYSHSLELNENLNLIIYSTIESLESDVMLATEL